MVSPLPSLIGVPSMSSRRSTTIFARYSSTPSSSIPGEHYCEVRRTCESNKAIGSPLQRVLFAAVFARIQLRHAATSAPLRAQNPPSSPNKRTHSAAHPRSSINTAGSRPKPAMPPSQLRIRSVPKPSMSTGIFLTTSCGDLAPADEPNAARCDDSLDQIAGSCVTHTESD